MLVVDDTPDERDLFAEMLGRQGAVVTVAANVDAALEAVERTRPEIVVSDIAMPVQDGYELLRRLRSHANPSIARTPAVAVTAHARGEDPQTCVISRLPAIRCQASRSSPAGRGGRRGARHDERWPIGRRRTLAASPITVRIAGHSSWCPDSHTRVRDGARASCDVARQVG